MFGIGTQELLIILVIALVVIGPKHLPDMAKALGRGIGEFRRATDELKKTIDADDDLKEISKSLSEAKEEVYSMVREEISELKDLKDTAESMTSKDLFSD
ncbi:MAG: twin-arginine translocase subunit TatB [Deltaproteobacteria bacterium]|nr:twin-arginine translocase subunit TatB [Deltaproteobacteria bacterium]